MDRHRIFAQTFSGGHLKIQPRMPTMLLTCLDARIDPARLFGLELGDAFVMRNAGGRITPDVIRDIRLLAAIVASSQGSDPPTAPPGLVIIHHTDCGLARLTDPVVQARVATRLGIETAEVAKLAAPDPAASVRSDIEKLRQTSGTPDHLIVSGLVYDVFNGSVTNIVAPAPLRTT